MMHLKEILNNGKRPRTKRWKIDMAIVVVDDIEYELKDHQLCGISREKNCSRCRYLEGCARGYEGHAKGSPYRNKQTFRLANPNIE